MTEDELSAALATMAAKLVIRGSDEARMTRTARCNVTLAYVPADPYAVHLLLAIDPDDIAVWVLGRHLLLRGMQGRTGEGAIVVWPGRTEDGTPVVYVGMRGREVGLLELPATELAAFLVDTLWAVPIGIEGLYCDVGGELAALLSGPS